MASSMFPSLALCFACCPSACLLLGCLSLPFALPSALQHAFPLAASLCPLLCLLRFSMPSAWLPVSVSSFAFWPTACLLLGCLFLPFAFCLRLSQTDSTLQWAGAPSLRAVFEALMPCLSVLLCCLLLPSSGAFCVLPVLFLRGKMDVGTKLPSTSASATCTCTR